MNLHFKSILLFGAATREHNHLQITSPLFVCLSVVSYDPPLMKGDFGGKLYVCIVALKKINKEKLRLSIAILKNPKELA